MDNILRTLSASRIAVDLGCGRGSFNYASYECRIIAIDVALNPGALHKDRSRVQYIRANSNALPLASGSVDAFVCNHTFEHFPEYRHTLREIDRTLNADGMLWIAVPDGHGFDDHLYRSIFHGGGHCNRFRRGQLTQEVESETGLKLVQSNSLFSGFVYLRKPTREQLPFFRFPAKFLYYLPDHLNIALILGMNATTRMADKLLRSHMSQYGWGFVFARHRVDLDPLPSFFNVCWKCGSGNPAEQLKSGGRVKTFIGLRFFCCANCGARNVFFDPPQGLS